MKEETARHENGESRGCVIFRDASDGNGRKGPSDAGSRSHGTATCMPPVPGGGPEGQAATNRAYRRGRIAAEPRP